MIDFLYSLDKAIFHFINYDLANPFFDAVMPYVTDFHKYLLKGIIGKAIVGIIFLYVLWKGYRKTRTVALLIIPLVVISDQLSSAVIKPLVMRPRPCTILPEDFVHLLVTCTNYSFPSSHAVNNFALATFLTYYYSRWRWAFFSFATVIALSRVIVGVHYPSDILGGAIIGVSCAYLIIWLWKFVEQKYPKLAIVSEVEKNSPELSSKK